MDSRANRRYFFMHPLIGASWAVWRRLKQEHQIDSRHWPKACTVSLFTAATAPLRLLDALRMRNPPATALKPPIFIIGHWRSGTTYLHDLICQDPRFGYVSTYHTIFPGSCVSGKSILAPLVAARMPRVRPMDNMKLTLFGPQEDEIALAHMTPHSYYHALYFPCAMRHFFDRYVLFDGASDDEKVEWAQAYRALLEKASHLADGRQLVLKNPANTGRIRALLDLFPDAKFIHIYRNPFSVLPSSVHFYDRVLALTALQRIDRQTLENNVYAMYRVFMERSLALLETVPERQWAEVRFEDLERDPIGELQRIYDRLELGPFDGNGRFASYVAETAGYQKNRFPMTPDVADRVMTAAEPFVNRWGYAPPASA